MGKHNVGMVPYQAQNEMESRYWKQNFFPDGQLEWRNVSQQTDWCRVWEFLSDMVMTLQDAKAKKLCGELATLQKFLLNSKLLTCVREKDRLE